MTLRIQARCCSRIWLAAAVAATGWPVMEWYFRRMTDRSDEPLGLLALGLAANYAPRENWRAAVRPAVSWTAAGLLLFYAAAIWFSAPALVRALFWLAAIGVLIAPGRGFLAWFSALLLSLPLVASLQFYLGYPLRWVITSLAAGLLSCFGETVQAEGVMLSLAGQQVLIDAPCAGIQMGWTLSLLAVWLALEERADAPRTLEIFRENSALIFLTNLVRVCALFLLQARLHVSAEWLHEGVGLGCFFCAALFLLRGKIWGCNKSSPPTKGVGAEAVVAAE